MQIHHHGLRFLAERCNRCNCIAKFGYCHMLSVCLSVCLSSVTRAYCNETAEARITRFLLKSSELS